MNYTVDLNIQSEAKVENGGALRRINVQCRKSHQSFIMTSSGTTPVQDVDEETTKMVQETINKIKSQGLFDQFRRDCLIDVDTKVNNCQDHFGSQNR